MQKLLIRVRPMEMEDAPAVAALIRAAFATQPAELAPPASALGVTADAVIRHLAQAGGGVADDDARLAGALLWEPTDDALYVSRLAVAPPARRRGIARALLAAAEAEARRRGLVRLTLGTRLAPAGNRRLFAGCGYVEITEHAHPGCAAPTWVEMEKRLA